VENEVGRLNLIKCEITWTKEVDEMNQGNLQKVASPEQILGLAASSTILGFVHDELVAEMTPDDMLCGRAERFLRECALSKDRNVVAQYFLASIDQCLEGPLMFRNIEAVRAAQRLARAKILRKASKTAFDPILKDWRLPVDNPNQTFFLSYLQVGFPQLHSAFLRALADSWVHPDGDHFSFATTLTAASHFLHDWGLNEWWLVPKCIHVKGASLPTAFDKYWAKRVPSDYDEITKYFVRRT